MDPRLNQLKDYFRSNPGALFILAFMVLLLSAAPLLTTGRQSEADSIANYAFYALIVGIVIQIGVAVREERKHSHRRDNSPSDSS